MLFSKVYSFLKKYFNRYNSKYKKSKSFTNKGSILIIDVGTYVSDSGVSDYSTSFKIKKGQVNKVCISKMKKNEDTYMFNTFKLIPVTKSVFIEVKKHYLSGNPNYFEIYNIQLLKNIKKQKVIKI